jgi:hypothetical protein
VLKGEPWAIRGYEESGGRKVSYKLKRVVVAVAALAVALTLASGALAASSKKHQAYAGAGGAVQGKVQSGAVANANQVRTVGNLPFTGLQLTLVVGAGLALLLTGGTLRRLSKNRA